MSEGQRSKYRNAELTRHESESVCGVANTDEAVLSLLMELRDELQKLNRVFEGLRARIAELERGEDPDITRLIRERDAAIDAARKKQDG